MSDPNCAHTETADVFTMFEDPPELVARICRTCDGVLPADSCLCQVEDRIIDDPDSMVCRVCGGTVLKETCWRHNMQKDLKSGFSWCSTCGYAKAGDKGFAEWFATWVYG